MSVTARGYITVCVPRHPRGKANGMVFEHILVVERVLGRTLPLRNVVHHVDGDRARNTNDNLVACEDQAYHLLLHRRARALELSGDASNVQCWYCKGWDRPESFDGSNRKGQYHHKRCAAEWQQARRDRLRAGRPKHLEIVAARPTCVNGHPWTEESTRICEGTRFCRVCERERTRNRRRAS